MSTIPDRIADQLFENLWVPEETRELRLRVRDFAEKEIRPCAQELNTTPEDVEKFPHEMVKKMGGAGLFAIPFGAEVGGAGLEHPTLGTMVMLEETAYLSSGLAAALVDVQLILFGHTLEFASDGVREQLFPRLLAGDIVGAFATSEPDASTDLRADTLKTEAVTTSDGYVLNGRKRWITNSPVADYMFVLARHEGGMSMFLVDMKSEGVKVGEPDRKMGNHCQLTADVYFDNVAIHPECIVGLPGKGLRAALRSLTLGRVGIGACGVGMAQAAFDFAVSYMQRREVFGKPLANFQYWQFKFAEYACDLESARNLYIKAALAVEQDLPAAQSLCAMAKLRGSELAGTIARDAIQVCGGYGFVKELAASGEHFPLEAIYRDSKIGEIYEGANEIQRMLVARAIFGKGAVG